MELFVISKKMTGFFTYFFQGSIVALKIIQHKTRIDINRLLLMEVKTVRMLICLKNILIDF